MKRVYLGSIWLWVLFLLVSCSLPDPIQSELTTEKRQEVSKEALNSDAKAEVILEKDANEKIAETNKDVSKSPLSWSKSDLKFTIHSGVKLSVALPQLVGGVAPIQTKIGKGSSFATLMNHELHFLLDYNLPSKIYLEVVATDLENQSAVLSIEITVVQPLLQERKGTTSVLPTPTANPVLLFCENKIVVMGGMQIGSNSTETSTLDTWFWNRKNKAWSKATHEGELPPAFSTARAVVHSVQNQGEQAEGLLIQAMKSNYATLDAIYRFQITGDKITWKKLSHTGDLKNSQVAISSLGYFQKAQKIVLFSGLDLYTGKVDENLYELTWSGDSITSKIVAFGTGLPRPTGRYGASFAIDSTKDRLFVVAGFSQQFHSDVWELTYENGSYAWKEWKTKSPITGTKNGSLFYDSQNNRLFQYGGSAGTYANPEIFSLSLDETSPSWKKILVPTEMSSRTSIGAVVDPVNGEAFVGFGRNPSFLNDFWSIQLYPAP